MFSKEIYINRRMQLKSKLDKGIALFMGNHEAPCNYKDNTYHFRQDSTFLYYFGLDEPDLAAVIDFESGAEILFADDVSIDDIVWTGPLPKMQEKAALVGVKDTLSRGKLGEFIQKALQAGTCRIPGFGRCIHPQCFEAQQQGRHTRNRAESKNHAELP